MLFNLSVLEQTLQCNFPWPHYVFFWGGTTLICDFQYIAESKIRRPEVFHCLEQIYTNMFQLENKKLMKPNGNIFRTVLKSICTYLTYTYVFKTLQVACCIKSFHHDCNLTSFFFNKHCNLTFSASLCRLGRVIPYFFKYSATCKFR